ncbi:MAG: hypothetical protein QME25_07775, partial [Bacteroidota bacterium]|nr:hypothetical protein [Bacteroidota bacterium]
MKKFTILFGLFIFLLGVYSCKEQVTPVDDKSKIAQLVGLVSEFIKNNQVPVKDAVVSITGDGINLKDTTDNLGNYSFSVRLDTSKILLYTVTKTGYKTKVLSGTVSPGTTIIRDFEIQVDTTITIGTVSGNPHTIAYLGPQTIELSVYGVGGEESKLASYEVRDSLGNSIKSEGKDTITFSLNGIPVQGGAYVSPVYGIISPAGKAITTVNSGTISGVVQLEASIRRAADGKIIKSTPVKVIINAGLPDQSFFTISAERYNFPALNLPNKTNTISVQVGDKYSNPVQQNTAVYFNTTSGVIEGAGYTSPSGQISKTLSSGNPFPANGTAWVRAFTIGQDGISVSDSVRIIFSGKPAITVAPDSIEVTHGSFQDFTVTIIDQNGNPLASGTTVTSTIEFTKPDGTNWNAVVSGLPTESFGDHRDPGLNVTQFSMRVTDTTPEGGTPEKMPVIIKITVTGDNGKLTKVIYGTVGSKTTSGGLTGSGYPYSITYGGPTTIPLSVSGVGGVESKLVSYEVRDSVGNPISLDKKDTVVFTITGPTSMGGTLVSPVFAITDANGKATTTIYSGTVSGVFQLTATLRRDDNG